jgi:hypothetical protein
MQNGKCLKELIKVEIDLRLVAAVIRNARQE